MAELQGSLKVEQFPKHLLWFLPLLAPNQGGDVNPAMVYGVFYSNW